MGHLKWAAATRLISRAKLLLGQIWTGYSPTSHTHPTLSSDLSIFITHTNDPLSSSVLWLRVTQTSIRQFGDVSELGELDNAVDAMFVCLHQRDARALDRATLETIRLRVGAASSFFFLIPRQTPELDCVAYGPSVQSFACSGALLRSARLWLGTHALGDAYLVAEWLLNHAVQLPVTRCLQIPAATHAGVTTRNVVSESEAGVEWVVPHQGNLEYLEKCLRSVALSAPQIDKVVVCLDEPYTQAHEELLLAYPAYRFFTAEPSGNGPYVARDYFGRNTLADIVMHQDSDDIACVDRRTLLVAEMMSRGLDLVGSHELRIDEINRKIVPVRFPLTPLPASMAPLCRHVLFHPTSAIRADALRRAGGFSTHRTFANDTEFLYRAMLCLRVGNVDEFLYVRRKRENSLSTAPATAIGTPVRDELSAAWGRDFPLVQSGQMSVEESSFRLQHRPDYGNIVFKEVVGARGDEN